MYHEILILPCDCLQEGVEEMQLATLHLQAQLCSCPWLHLCPHTGLGALGLSTLLTGEILLDHLVLLLMLLL